MASHDSANLFAPCFSTADLTPEQKDALIIDLVKRLNVLEAKLEKG